MAVLYRAMREDADGFPLLVNTSRGLGIRPELDIPVDDEGFVEPESGGMSVSRDSPENLPIERRPASLGGIGKDPVWELDEEELSEALIARPDPDLDGHSLVEPRGVMTFADCEDAIAETRLSWRRIELT